MSCLAVGFYGEGPREYGFLLPIVERSLQELLPHVDILMIPLDYVDVLGLDQVDKIVRVAEETYGYGLVVFHLDADAPDTEKAYLERFEPGYDEIHHSAANSNLNTDLVPVIPVRMTDAWMLVDFEAFREVVGTKLNAGELGFKERPHQVESIQSPKAVFADAVRRARPRRRRAIRLDSVYRPLALRISLDKLRQVPAYQVFLDRLRNVPVVMNNLF
jgi:hypothetical protein